MTPRSDVHDVRLTVACCLLLLTTACQSEPVDTGPEWPSRVRCELQRDGASELAGTCVAEGAPNRAIRMTSLADSDGFSLQGTWWVAGRRPVDPPERLSRLIGVGRAVIAVSPPSDTLYREGLVETYWGAYSLDAFVESDGSLVFAYHFGEETYVRPTPVDLRILSRTRDLLSDESVWDREDDRGCDDESEIFSLYCALFRATFDIIGSSHHHQPAMNAVRDAIVESYASRRRDHALMDFNNHELTSFDEVKEVIDRAETLLRQQLGR